MNYPTIFLLAAVVAVLTFAKDVVAHLKLKRLHLQAEERDSFKEPLEIRSMVLGNVQDSVALQTAILVDYRTDIVRLREEVALKDKAIVDLRASQVDYEKKLADLYRTIGILQTRNGSIPNE